MVFSRTVATRLQPYFGHRSRTRLVLSARALRCRPAAFGKGSRWQAMRTMVMQFASREVAGVRVRLLIEREDGFALERMAVSDREGFVHFDEPLAPEWDLPAYPQWEIATLSWTNSEGPQTMNAHVLVPGRESDLAVISDIDDTIIESGITGGLRNIARNWQRIFAQLPHQRIAVPGADIFYRELGGGMVCEGESRAKRRMAATHRPFFYISSSPWNLFSYIVAFQRTKGLPLGPLKLRDWGLNRQTFGSGSHGAHKTAAINAILEMYSTMRFALIGDDTQGDLPAFANAVTRFPGRVAAIFLRRAAEENLSTEEVLAQESIAKAGIPLWLGESFAEGIDFLRQSGFSPGDETEQIVRVVEKVETSKEMAEEKLNADAG